MSGQFVAQDDHVSSLSLIQVIEPASLLERKITDLIVLRLYSDDLAVGGGEFADRTNVIAGKHRRSIADMGSFLADIRIILVSEQIIASGTHISRDHRSAARKNEHDVFAEFGQIALVSRAEAFA